MSVTVSTKQELKEAIKNKEKSIIITDTDLANHVKNIKTAKKLTKWTVGLLVVGASAGAIGIALAPATGGLSAGAGGMIFSVSAATSAAAGAGLSAAAIVSIVALSILGVALIIALWKDYDIRIAQMGPIKGIELFRR